MTFKRRTDRGISLCLSIRFFGAGITQAKSLFFVALGRGARSLKRSATSFSSVMRRWIKFGDCDRFKLFRGQLCCAVNLDRS